MSRTLIVVTGLALLSGCGGGGSQGPAGGGGSGAAGAGNSMGGAGTTGSGGSSSGNGPTVSSFTADPSNLPAGGGMVTLSWSVTGADQISIDNGIGAVTGTSKTTTVAATTIFTLTATNAMGTTTKSAVVTVASSASDPVILSFSATPANLPAGGGSTTLRWEVLNATSLSIDHGVGTVTGTSAMASVTATTIFTLTATNADGSSTATTAVVIGSNPGASGGRAVNLVAPSGGEGFIAPATLRLVASGRDPNIDTNNPRDGLGGNASKVQFFVDDAVVLEVAGDAAEYWVFKGFTSGVAPGTHRVWARAIYVNPALVLDSPPHIITVLDPPTYAQTMELTADMSLSGAGLNLSGTATGRIRLNGNGHRITGSGGLTLKFVDAFDLGNRTDTGNAGVDITTSAAVTIEDSTFDNSNTIRISQSGSASASIRRNVFRSNMRMPLGQNPDSGVEQPSYPAVRFGGTASGTKVFAGNNIGAGWVGFNGTANWLVGGDTDADSNVCIGPRVGIFVQDSNNMQVRRNFTHHVYYGGWSQGNNMELNGSPTAVVEHNVVYGGSWPVRGVSGEFRYNLVADAGHEWLWIQGNNASVHHNLFVGGESDIGGIYVLDNPTGVKIFNNTFDGQSHKDMVTAIKLQAGTVASLVSNAFVNVPKAPTVSIEGSGVLTTADYNAFGNPQTTNYSDNRKPTHDVSAGARVDPKFTAAPSQPFDVDLELIWKRSTTVRDILTLYRMRYTPQAGSPLIDVGDPAGGSGNDVGAVGAGGANASDKFGLF